MTGLLITTAAGLLWGWLVLWAARETARGWRRALDRHAEEQAWARRRQWLRDGDLTGSANKTRQGQP